MGSHYRRQPSRTPARRMGATDTEEARARSRMPSGSSKRRAPGLRVSEDGRRRDVIEHEPFDPDAEGTRSSPPSPAGNLACRRMSRRGRLRVESPAGVALPSTHRPGRQRRRWSCRGGTRWVHLPKRTAGFGFSRRDYDDVAVAPRRWRDHPRRGALAPAPPRRPPRRASNRYPGLTYRLAAAGDRGDHRSGRPSPCSAVPVHQPDLPTAGDRVLRDLNSTCATTKMRSSASPAAAVGPALGRTSDQRYRFGRSYGHGDAQADVGMSPSPRA